jgi:diaminopimelate epimerase
MAMIAFTKLHGCGNDYLYVDAFNHSINDPNGLSREISDRHFGVGSDGLIMLMPSSDADVRMRMFNADGSEGEMCGNGIRCLAKFAYERNRSRSNPMRIETRRGILTLKLQIESDRVLGATVDMLEPILEAAKIPSTLQLPKIVNYPVAIGGLHDAFPITCVSMGSPHATFFVEDVDKIELEKIGPRVENLAIFPSRINFHVAQIINQNEIKMRSWERGSGITLACGTGACATVVAGSITGRCDRKVLVHLPGGDLKIDWRHPDNHVYMTGPATEVFSGEWLYNGQ